MSSILNRRLALNLQDSRLNADQIQQDRLLVQFQNNLGDGSALAAMTGAGFAYRYSNSLF